MAQTIVVGRFLTIATTIPMRLLQHAFAKDNLSTYAQARATSASYEDEEERWLAHTIRDCVGIYAYEPNMKKVSDNKKTFSGITNNRCQVCQRSYAPLKCLNCKASFCVLERPYDMSDDATLDDKLLCHTNFMRDGSDTHVVLSCAMKYDMNGLKKHFL